MNSKTKEYLEDLPIIAIIRGVEPDEAVDITEALFEGGIRIVEVPLNSPDPYTSIKNIVRRFSGKMLIGAGTVLSEEQVQKVKDVGGEIIVSPNANVDVIGATKSLNMVSYPGVMTVTECFSAMASGADGLKLFPANVLGPAFVKAVKAVLPRSLPLFSVGGVGEKDMKVWLKAGVTGFGIGGSLYQPGMLPEMVLDRTREIVRVFKTHKING